MRGRNNPVAWDNQWDRVTPVGLSNGSCATADLARDIKIAARLAVRDLAQRAPDLQPVGGSGGSQRQVEFSQLPVEIRFDLLLPSIENRR